METTKTDDALREFVKRVYDLLERRPDLDRLIAQQIDQNHAPLLDLYGLPQQEVHNGIG